MQRAHPPSLPSRFQSPKKCFFLSLSPISLGADRLECGLPSGPKSCCLIPRTLDTGTHCLKVLFVSPVGQYALFDLFYNFVIMGCNGLGCLNIMVITFHCSYPNPSKRGGLGKVRKSLEKEDCALPSCSSRLGWV